MTTPNEPNLRPLHTVLRDIQDVFDREGIAGVEGYTIALRTDAGTQLRMSWGQTGDDIQVSLIEDRGMKSKVISKPGSALEVRVIPQSDETKAQIAHSLKHGPNAAFIKRVKAMSAKECMAASIRAGIHNPDGTLTERYRD